MASRRSSPDMNTDQLIHEKYEDADLALRVIINSTSPAFRQAAARQLVDIAAQLQAAVGKTEPLQPEPAEPRPVIDLAMKYRTRDGREVTNLHIRDHSSQWPIWGDVSGMERNWTKYGDFTKPGDECDCDLIPTGEPA